MPLDNIITRDVQQFNGSKLNLANSGIYDVDVDELVELLKEKVALTSLDLSNNNINDESIIKIINSLNSLRSFYISRTNLDEKGVEVLANKSIEVLDISYNRLSDKAGKYLAAHSRQHYITMERTNMSAAVKDEIYKKLKENKAHLKKGVSSAQLEAKKESALTDLPSTYTPKEKSVASNLYLTFASKKPLDGKTEHCHINNGLPPASKVN